MEPGDDIRAEVAVLRAELVAHKVMTEKVFTMHERAGVVAMEANNLRLDVLNEFRQTVEDMLAKMMPRTDSEMRHRVHEERLSREINLMHERVDAATKPNYVLAVAVVSVGVTIVGSAWVAIGLKIDAAVAPVYERVSYIKAIQEDVQREIIRLRDWRVSFLHKPQEP